MIKNKLTILIIILFSCLLFSCQTAKEALEGKKRSEQSDEFLVEKKNPLVKPPEYGKLPAPTDTNVKQDISDTDDIEKLLGSQNTNQETIELGSSSNKIEENILEKIKNK